MRTVAIPIEEEILFTLKIDIPKLQTDFMQILAMQYFKERRLGLGLAARLADMTKNDFVSFLSRYGIDIYQYSDEELESEFALVDEIAGALQ